MMSKEATEIIAKLEELKSKLQSRIGYYGIRETYLYKIENAIKHLENVGVK